MFRDEKYDVRLSRFKDTNQNGFHPRTLCVKASIKSRELVKAFTDANLEKTISEKALFNILSALGDDPLQAVWNCTRAMPASYKLHTRYAGFSMVDKLSILNTVLDTKFKRNDHKGIHIAVFRPQFSRLAMMGSKLDESTEVAILLSLLPGKAKFAAFAASVRTIQEQSATWNYVFTLFMEEQKRIFRSQAFGASSSAQMLNSLL